MNGAPIAPMNRKELNGRQQKDMHSNTGLPMRRTDSVERFVRNMHDLRVSCQ
jgi:hypothetical protein